MNHVIVSAGEARIKSEFPLFVNAVLRHHRNLDFVRPFSIDFTFSSSGVFPFDPQLDGKELGFGPRLEEAEVRFADAALPEILCKLPDSLYILEKLKVSQLGRFRMTATGFVSLPSLKTLLISDCTTNIETLRRLLSGRPVLKDLTLCFCSLEEDDDDEEKEIVVSSPSLRDLHIEMNPDDTESLCRSIIVIEAPELRNLYLADFTSLQFRLLTPFRDVASAKIFTTRFTVGSHQALIGLIIELSNVHEVRLIGKTAEYLRSGGEDVWMPAFPKLHKVNCPRSHLSWIVHFFMRKAGNLKYFEV
ncbi:unnamed protein product [Linum trigynum]|uniref:F-box/LRR-repeat protein 15/At3g58940/PEG3-like LRR domain-containing protein n=1 Tax=Linum trigynum TaxID=586398 RepID=A0AAV2G7I0_9ROSI